MAAAQIDLEVPRNGHYHEGWVLNDADRVPIDLTGHSLDLKIRAIAGTGSILSTAVIDIYDPVNGLFNITIDGSTLDSYGSTTEVLRLAYDLKHTYPDGIKQILTRGQILLVPEVTP
jgi:FlaG/FlaF family flagellin (archaellin)